MQKSARYVLESSEETNRLQEQAKLPGYLISEELAGLKLPENARVLDAGCGSGLLLRYLHSHFPTVELEGCDASEIRLRQAKDLSEGPFSSIRYFTGNLEELERPDNTYDWVFCRYVFEHLPDPARVCAELFRVLKPSGTLSVIDFDGLIFNFFSENADLMKMLAELKNKLICPNLFIGREIPRIMRDAGFNRIHWKVQVIRFDDQTIEGEILNTRQRFSFAMPLFTKIFGTEARARKFADMYCSEMTNPKTCFFYNKMTVNAEKSS